MTQLSGHKANFSTVPFTGQFYALLPTQQISRSALIMRLCSVKPFAQNPIAWGRFAAKSCDFVFFCSPFFGLQLARFEPFQSQVNRQTIYLESRPSGQVLIISMHIYITQICGAFYINSTVPQTTEYCVAPPRCLWLCFLSNKYAFTSA